MIEQKRMITDLVDSKTIIDFLKQHELYIEDNEVVSHVKYIGGIDNSIKYSMVWIKHKEFDLNKLLSDMVLVGENFSTKSTQKTIIKTKDPKLSFVLAANEFFIENTYKSYTHPTASICPSVKTGKNVTINENVVIGENCTIGNNVIIYPNSVIYPNTEIGDGVTINAGAKIGQEGFGYIQNLEKRNIQFPHFGKVIIESYVEIGSNTCIDRGALSDTLIGEHTKINNLCHIAHNVHIGKNCLIAAKVEISGSVKVADNVYIGSNATIIDGIAIGADATIGMGAIVRSNIKEKSTIVPFESMEKRAYIKALRKLRD